MMCNIYIHIYIYTYTAAGIITNIMPLIVAVQTCAVKDTEPLLKLLRPTMYVSTYIYIYMEEG